MDLSVKGKQWCNFRSVKVLGYQNGRISVISSNIIDIYIARIVDNIVKYLPKGMM